MAKELLHKKAVELRKAGYSYTYIQRKISVSKSTLSAWLSDLPYKRNQETIEVINRARLMANEAKREIKRKSIKDAEELAIKDIGKFTKRDLFMFGIGLYTGEGSKTDGLVRAVNSDPEIIKTFILWFKKILNLQNINFSIRIHMYPDNDPEKVIAFWMKEIGLPKSVFSKPYIDARIDKKRKNFGKLPYGTAHLTIRNAGNIGGGSFVLRRILAWILTVHKNAGIV